MQLLGLGCGGPGDTDAIDTDEPEPARTAAEADATIVGPGAGGRPTALAVADVNADGMDDLIAAGPLLPGACVFRGPIAGDLVWADAIGCFSADGTAPSAVSVSDDDGDGVVELLFGSPSADTTALDAGRAWLVLGPVQGQVGPEAAWASFDGEAALDGAGTAATLLPGGGVAISAPDHDANGPGGGRVYVWPDALASGARALADAPLIIEGTGNVARHGSTEGGEAAGYSLAHGDVDSDGLDDLVVSFGGYDGRVLDGGAVAVFLGPAGDGVIGLPEADVRITSDRLEGYLGEPVTVLPDLDDDGADELFIAVISTYGRAWRFSGVTPGDHDVDDALTTFVEADTYDGIGVAFAPIPSDSGHTDVVVGAAFADAFGSNTGAVWRVPGPLPSGTVELRSVDTIVGAQNSDLFGAALASGDLDGDGVPDLVVGGGSPREGGDLSVFFGGW